MIWCENKENAENDCPKYEKTLCTDNNSGCGCGNFGTTKCNPTGCGQGHEWCKNRIVDCELAGKMTPELSLLKMHPHGFKHWCQHVLPTVYDDSLSYYELLSKFVKWLQLMGNDVENLFGAFEELQCWLNCWLSQGHLTQEIERVLDWMSESGFLTAFLVKYITYGSGIKIEITEEEVEYECKCKCDCECCCNCEYHTFTRTIYYMNIHSDLIAGDGVTIEPESSTTPGAQTISCNLSGGGGVEIVPDDEGGLIITMDLSKLIDYGSGVKITSNSNVEGGVIIYSDFKAGNGITISPSSSTTKGTQTWSLNLVDGYGSNVVVNSDGSVQIDLALQAGPGISLSNDGNTIIITNTDYSTANRKRLNVGCTNDGATASDGYDALITWYNRFYRIDDDTYTTYTVLDSSYPNGERSVFRVYVTPTYDNKNNIIGGTVDCRLSPFYFRGNIANQELFAFRHSQTIEEVPLSRVCMIYFPQNSDYSALSNTSGNTLVVNANPSGIANLHAYYNDSFHNVGVCWEWIYSWTTSSDIINNRMCFVLSATSISDGYNAQISSNPNTNGYSMYTPNHLNFNNTKFTIS